MNNLKKRILLIVLLLSVCFLNPQTTHSAAVHAGDINSKITKFLSDWNIIGAEVAITKDGKLIYNKGVGYSDLKKSHPAKADDLYRIASVSKSITAIGIMKLVEGGHLFLTDTVFGMNRILDQPYYLNVVSDQRIFDITVEELLEHTGGWDRIVPCDGYAHSDPAFFPLHVSSSLGEPNPVGDSTLIKFLLKKGLDHQPGTVYAYSNVGYLVLGKIIEKISGMKYEEYINAAIFKPAGISNIHLGKNLFENRMKNETEYCGDNTVLSCYGNGNRVPWQYGGFNVEAMNAHGGWIATAEDLTKLMLAVDGNEATCADILKPETIAQMSQPGAVNPGYAKGWCVNTSGNCWHTGSMDGTSSFICKTADGYTWAFLFNSRSDNSSAFWKAFDRLPWDCLKAMNSITMVN